MRCSNGALKFGLTTIGGNATDRCRRHTASEKVRFQRRHVVVRGKERRASVFASLAHESERYEVGEQFGARGGIRRH